MDDRGADGGKDLHLNFGDIGFGTDEKPFITSHSFAFCFAVIVLKVFDATQTEGGAGSNHPKRCHIGHHLFSGEQREGQLMQPYFFSRVLEHDLSKFIQNNLALIVLHNRVFHYTIMRRRDHQHFGRSQHNLFVLLYHHGQWTFLHPGHVIGVVQQVYIVERRDGNHPPFHGTFQGYSLIG
eukprot:Lithocolla_globosa_v1_NODE_1116_length_2857_cov_13.628255.p2 type:complete len:181 gc:universal NODE_1116_length_2857_cov_13.628255:972-430(-)